MPCAHAQRSRRVRLRPSTGGQCPPSPVPAGWFLGLGSACCPMRWPRLSCRPLLQTTSVGMADALCQTLPGRQRVAKSPERLARYQHLHNLRLILLQLFCSPRAWETRQAIPLDTNPAADSQRGTARHALRQTNEPHETRGHVLSSTIPQRRRRARTGM